MSKRLFLNLALFLTVVSTLSFASVARAATLSLIPSSGTVVVGDIFTVKVAVNSEGKAINVVESDLRFPTDLLEIVSVDKSGSIFSIWVQEPSFSNSDGTVSFSGGLPNPGYTGTSGKVVSVIFRAKTAGKASLLFDSPTVRANDGLGTDVLRAVLNASFTIVSKAGAAGTPSEAGYVTPTPGAPSAPQVTSKTHPDSAKWYNNNTPSFEWKVPDGVTKVQTLIGQYPDSLPQVTYSPPISSKTSDVLPDGIWYFHIRFANDNGWGAIAHYRVQIDTEKPEFTDLHEMPQADSDTPNVSFYVAAEDKTSGIDHYEVKLDDAASYVWNDPGDHILKISSVSPGGHTLIVKAFDGAGNSASDSLDFNVIGIEPPTITHYDPVIRPGTPIIVDGTTYQLAGVVLRAENGTAIETYNGKADSQGKFTVSSDNIKESGTYYISLKATDTKGSQSAWTSKLAVAVRQSSFIIFGSMLVSVLSVVTPSLAIIIILLFLIWYAIHRFRVFKKRLEKELRDIDENVHRAFRLLKKNMKNQMRLLEKAQSRRELTKEDEEIIEQLSRDLEDAEKYLSGKVEHMEKEV